ncbi:hypothetical protein FJZ53_04250 [Candidatus Woesearchaeota archaeon]|nr:hypothetical protein [Candidatus Woesearchaeota archaeon]
MGISLDELRIVADKKGFDLVLLEKDYLITELLYTIKGVIPLSSREYVRAPGERLAVRCEVS